MALQMQLVVVIFILVRMNMPIALVCMIDSSPAQNASLLEPQDMMSPANSSFAAEESQTGERNSSFGTNSTTKRGEFRWESSTQGLVLSAANMLGFVMPLMTDFFSRLVGGKRLLLIGMAMTAICTILQPIGARMSPYILIALRMGVGLAGGMAMPLITEVFSWWSPGEEKVSMVSFAFAGVNIGNILVGVTSGYLCAIPFDNGWPLIFYVHGGICLLWCVMWQICGSIRPEDHPFISEEEKSYILKTRVGMDKSQKRSSPPYKFVLTSRPVWGFLGVMISHYFSVTIVFTYLPLYLSTVFRLNVEEVGLFSSVSYVARFLGTIMWGMLSTLIFSKTHHGTTVCRKLVQCTGFYVSGLSLIALGFINNQAAAFAILILVMVSQSATNASGIIVPLDIAPRYAGFISGLFMTAATIVSSPGPIIASMMTEQGTLEEWRNVFIMVAVVFFVGATIFLVLGSSKLQSWAVPADSDTGEEKNLPLASDLMNRRMTVLTLGPPLSPGDQQKRFQFTITVSEPNLELATVNEEDTSHPTADVNNINNSSTTATSGATTVLNNNVHVEPPALEKSISDTRLRRKVTAVKSTSSAEILPRSQSGNIKGPSYSNPGFEPDMQDAVGLSKNENGSNGALNCKKNGTLENGQKRRFSKNANRLPGLKLDVGKSGEVVFEVGGKVVQSVKTANDIKKGESVNMENDVTKGRGAKNENDVTSKGCSPNTNVGKNADRKTDSDKQFDEVDLGDKNEILNLEQTRL
ncbi:hypothetical protein V1264_007736 [Littorina saxatilis]|uniref:Major facilitator superfamily (MFS) profile domain-containing protein n=2 Tax=Littorina saxatilis TaxID=31220 RepID=A0AAN9AVE2_9CAEN